MHCLAGQALGRIRAPAPLAARPWRRGEQGRGVALVRRCGLVETRQPDAREGPGAPGNSSAVRSDRLCGAALRAETTGAVCRQLGELARRGSDFVALVLGDGELAGELRNDLRRHGLAGRVRMLGWQDEAALRELFQASDIFFLPSAGEGIALVLYEAMACGMAIVAADVGGHAELVSAHCGFLVPRRDAEREARDYAARLESLMREPEMLGRMGQNSARRIREAFTLSLFERRLRELLERVPVSTPCGVCTDSPVPALGAARLSMQWASYRLANGLRCRLDIQKHGRFSRFLERCAKGVFFLRTFGAKALWQKIRKH